MTQACQATRARAGDPGRMHSESELTDIVVFDVPSLSQARDLISRLEDRWSCYADQESNSASVSVFLSATRDPELAELFRTVEAWVAARSLGGIMFWLDGRSYLLRAHDPARAFSPI